LKPYTIRMFLIMLLCTPALAETPDFDPQQALQAASLQACIKAAHMAAIACDDEAQRTPRGDWEACYNRRDKEVEACEAKYSSAAKR
jgi:hypothetical protein